MIREVVANSICVLGLGLIAYGCWLAWHPLAFLVVGAAMCCVGVLVHRSGVKKGSP